MNFFKLLFMLGALWGIIYTISVASYNFKKHAFLSAFNAIFCIITLAVLCTLYVIK